MKKNAYPTALFSELDYIKKRSSESKSFLSRWFSWFTKLLSRSQVNAIRENQDLVRGTILENNKNEMPKSAHNAKALILDRLKAFKYFVETNDIATTIRDSETYKNNTHIAEDQVQILL
jgi:hypothetical protein